MMIPKKNISMMITNTHFRVPKELKGKGKGKGKAYSSEYHSSNHRVLWTTGLSQQGACNSFDYAFAGLGQQQERKVVEPVAHNDKVLVAIVDVLLGTWRWSVGVLLKSYPINSKQKKKTNGWMLKGF